MNFGLNKNLKIWIVCVCVLIGLSGFGKDLFAQKVRLRSQIKPSCNVIPPTRPHEFFAEISAAGDVAVQGGLGCLGAFIYDISNPDAPVLANWYTPNDFEKFHEIVVVGNRGYFGSTSKGGVHIVDLSNPYNPVLLGIVDETRGNGFRRVHEMIVWGNYLIENFHGSPNRINKIINVSNPANPVLVREIVTAEAGGWTHAMHVRGNRLFISNFGAFNQRGRTEIYDLSNIETQTPILLGTIIDNTTPNVGGDDWTHSSWTSEDGNYLYSCREKYENLPDWEGGDVRVYDIHNPAQPVLVNRITTNGLGLNAWAPHNPIVVGNYLYVAWYHAGLQIFDISNPANPVRVGQYDSHQPSFAPTAEELASLAEKKSGEPMCGFGNLRGVAAPTDFWGAWSAIPISQDKIVISDMFNGMVIVDASQITAPLKNQVSDFDGDRKTDFSVYSPNSGRWTIENSSNNSTAQTQFGLNGDKLVAGDYDGDGKSDIAIFRPAEGVWYVLGSTRGLFIEQFGINGDVPVPSDYDADGETDLAVFRPSNATWYVRQSTLGINILKWGISTDTPLVGDFEGDGRTDFAVFRPSDGTWYISQSSSRLPIILKFGIATDKPVVGNFDGDEKTDIAVYRPSEGNWYIFKSSDNSVAVIRFGTAVDIPIPSDFDGDGKADITVFRPSENVWYRLNSSNGAFSSRAFGANGDIPSPVSAQP